MLQTIPVYKLTVAQLVKLDECAGLGGPHSQSHSRDEHRNPNADLPTVNQVGPERCFQAAKHSVTETRCNALFN